MKTRILSILLFSAAFPLTALAQETTVDPAANQPQKMDKATTTAGTNDAAGASAQTTDMAVSAEDTFVTVPETGAWRVSDLQGKAVYGSDGESIGEINDILVSQDGSVNAVIIGVGGFLGIAEKDVAVDMAALKLGPGDTQQQADAASQSTAVTGETTASTTTGTAGTDDMATTGQDTAAMDNDANVPGSSATTADQMAANNASDAQIGNDALPDRIILNVTREELENAPAFEGVRVNK